MIKTIALVVLCIFLFSIALSCWDEKVKERGQNRAKKNILRYFTYIYCPVLTHVDTLARAYERGRMLGDYGELIEDGWKTEIRYFVEKVIMPSLPKQFKAEDVLFFVIPCKGNTSEVREGFDAFKFKLSKYIPDIKKQEGEIEFLYCFEKRIPSKYAIFDTVKLQNILRGSIESQVESLCDYLFDTTPKQKAMIDPIQYERVIAMMLRNLDFNAHTTKAGGDQGADVLAEKNGVKFAIQCKMYSKPVGNKAVQEANTARDFYKCDYAVVVSNAGYTKSARQLANTCGVILLNDNQLEKLNDYIQ